MGFKAQGDLSTSPAIASDGTIYVGSLDNKLYAVKPDGSKKWEFQTSGFIFSSPAIGSDGTIYFGSSDHHVYAVNSDGSLKWKFLTEESVPASPVIGVDNTIYLSTEGNLSAFNPDGTKNGILFLIARSLRLP